MPEHVHSLLRVTLFLVACLFSNNYIRPLLFLESAEGPMLTLAGMLTFWGFVFLGTTLYVRPLQHWLQLSQLMHGACCGEGLVLQAGSTR